MCKLARPERFELPTSWFVARRSIQLSYGRFDQKRHILADREGLLGAAHLAPSLRFGTAVAHAPASPCSTDRILQQDARGPCRLAHSKLLAEREGFEPSMGF